MRTLALWRFDETIATVRPRDVIGNVGDLSTEASLVMPTIVDAAMGRGRRFDADLGTGLVATDVVSGTTLLQRDLSVQAIVQWNLAAQGASGGAGTLYARGKSGSVAERLSAGIELYVVNAALNVGGIRWRWQDGVGTELVQDGGYFTPTGTDFMLLTATRRWISSSSLVLRYYLGAQLLAEVLSIDGSIGGGTTGATQIGARCYNGADYFYNLDGIIDELRVVDYELSPEEIEATWKRITVHQPRGYALVKELHDPGFPISDDPGSRVQLETRMWGHGLGFASAQAGNMRDNTLPDRAYGEVLEQWERVVAQPSKVGDSVDARQARVAAHIRQDLGVSIPGVSGALRELVATAPSNLQIVGFTQTVTDDYSGTRPDLRYTYDPTAQWTIVAGALQVASAAGVLGFDGSIRNWYTSRLSIGGAGRAVNIVCKVTTTTFAANGEAGLFVGDYVGGHFFLASLQFSSAGNVVIATEYFKNWISVGQVVQSAPLAWTTGWLHVFLQDTADPVGRGGVGTSTLKFTVAWSTTAEAGPYTSVVDIAAPAGWAPTTGVQWAGQFLRSVANAAVTLNVKFDDMKVRTPYADRAFNFYVYRDPSLPGSADLTAANTVLAGLKQAHTNAALVTSLAAIADDANSLADLTPVGG